MAKTGLEQQMRAALAMDWPMSDIGAPPLGTPRYNYTNGNFANYLMLIDLPLGKLVKDLEERIMRVEATSGSADIEDPAVKQIAEFYLDMAVQNIAPQIPKIIEGYSDLWLPEILNLVRRVKLTKRPPPFPEYYEQFHNGASALPDIYLDDHTSQWPWYPVLQKHHESHQNNPKQLANRLLLLSRTWTGEECRFGALILAAKLAGGKIMAGEKTAAQLLIDLLPHAPLDNRGGAMFVAVAETLPGRAKDIAQLAGQFQEKIMRNTVAGTADSNEITSRDQVRMHWGLGTVSYLADIASDRPPKIPGVVELTIARLKARFRHK